MWLVFALLTFFFWGVGQVFYKLANDYETEYSHLKTGMFVGIAMGIHATFYILLNPVDLHIKDALLYLPISILYISSMVIGYKGLKYLDLSICAPIQNASGVVTALLLLLFFHETISGFGYLAFLFIFIGVCFLSFIEIKSNQEERAEYRRKNSKSKFFILTIFFPLCYCLLDGLGSFLDGVYLDKLSLISEGSALVAYEYTFFLYAIVTYIYLKVKKQKISLVCEKNNILAAIFETAGQFFYVFAMAANSVVSAPIVGSYCILSLLLSRIFLKEKLTKQEYIGIFLVVIGVVILSILDI